MYTKQEIIISSFRDGKSQRQIARDLQISRKTVSKYIREYESILQVSQDKEAAQALVLSSSPSYKMSTPRPRVKLTEEVQSIIDDLLENNKKKLKQGLRKQLLKKVDIHEELLAKGFDVGYSTVCKYINDKNNLSSTKEAFIRQRYSPGVVCEFDWAEIKLSISGKLTTLQLAVFTSAYSNWRYAAIFNRQNTISFMEAHTSFFQALGGVYQEMVYDNSRVAISKFVGRHEKVPTKALLQLRGHYQFTHRFTNFYSGNEKGHVERSVEYVRRKAFALRDTFSSIAEAQQRLDATIKRLNDKIQQGTGVSANKLLLDELPLLGKHPLAVMICSEQRQFRVDKYSTISYQGNRYSAPDYLVGLFVDVNIGSRELHLFYENKLLCTHQRSYRPHDWVIDIEHYLDTFKKKPGALARSEALASSDYLYSLYTTYFKGEPRQFIDLLNYCRKERINDEKIEDSVKRLLHSGSGNITVEQLQALLGNRGPTIVAQYPMDQIALQAKQQLSWITQLMSQTR